MNLTLSADRRLVEAARKYARDHGTSLNQLIRDYLENLVGNLPRDDAAREFATVARTSPGDSGSSGIPTRDEIWRDRTDGIARSRKTGENH